jgi:hypothetical protein
MHGTDIGRCTYVTLPTWKEEWKDVAGVETRSTEASIVAWMGHADCP